MIEYLADTDSGSAGSGLGIVMLVLYLLPTIVALVRRVPNTGSVAVINLFLGWTIIGWIVRVGWPEGSPPRAPAEPGVTVSRHRAPTILIIRGFCTQAQCAKPRG
jgi:Superinfection immunity protein